MESASDLPVTSESVAPAAAAQTTEAIAVEPARLQYRRLYRLMALADGACVVLALFLGRSVRFGLHTPADIVLLTLVAPFAAVALFAAFRLYETHRLTTAEEFRRVVLAVSLGIMVLVALAFWSHSSLSRAWILSSWGFALVFMLVARRMWHWQIRREHEIGRLMFRTLIVGTNEEAVSIAGAMEDVHTGFSPVGFVQTASGSWNGSSPAAVGHIRNLRDVIRNERADCVFVAASAVSAEELKHVAKAVRLEGVEVRISATLPAVLASRLSAQPVGGMMSLALRPARLSRPQRIAKRAFDITVVSIGGLLSMPIWLPAAIAIKVDSRGPVLYKQRRVGEGGRPFVMLKFRTMHVGADAKVAELRHLSEMDGPMFKIRNDPRVTRMGRHLRKWSLDELPQLWNVLRGEMSIVGPRPPLPEEVAKYEEWQFARLEAPPGITGLWQVSGRSDLSFDEYVRRDLFYIENWSLTYDLYIVMKTIPVVLSHRGAY